MKRLDLANIYVCKKVLAVDSNAGLDLVFEVANSYLQTINV